MRQAPFTPWPSVCLAVEHRAAFCVPTRCCAQLRFSSCFLRSFCSSLSRERVLRHPRVVKSRVDDRQFGLYINVLGIVASCIISPASRRQMRFHFWKSVRSCCRYRVEVRSDIADVGRGSFVFVAIPRLIASHLQSRRNAIPYPIRTGSCVLPAATSTSSPFVGSSGNFSVQHYCRCIRWAKTGRMAVAKKCDICFVFLTWTKVYPWKAEAKRLS
jgi:hypothetical protein